MSTTTKVVLTPAPLPSSSRQPSLRLDDTVKVRSDAKPGDIIYQVPAEGAEQLWFSINGAFSAVLIDVNSIVLQTIAARHLPLLWTKASFT